jgi:predicted DNA-binding transcriptional regulator AlpA
MTNSLLGAEAPETALARVLDVGRRIEDYTLTKPDLARALGLSERSVDSYVKRGLLPSPLKFGRSRSARVRWAPADKETLMRNLAALASAQREAA